MADTDGEPANLRTAKNTRRVSAITAQRHRARQSAIPRGEIHAVLIENFNRGIRTWSVTMTVSDMKTLLEKFVALVEETERDARQPKRIA